MSLTGGVAAGVGDGDGDCAITDPQTRRRKTKENSILFILFFTAACTA